MCVLECVVGVCLCWGAGEGGTAERSIETEFVSNFGPDLCFPFRSSHTARKSIEN